jgi:hypothetical protein
MEPLQQATSEAGMKLRMPVSANVINTSRQVLRRGYDGSDQQRLKR